MIRPLFPSEVVNWFPLIVSVVSPVRPAASQLTNVPAYVPERSTCCVLVVGPCGVVCGVVGVCGAGSWALSAQNPPIARKVPSITNKNIFLIILSSRVRSCAPIRRTSALVPLRGGDKKEGTMICTTQSAKSQPYFVREGVNSAFSLGFFVVNIFCVQPQLTAEEANATRKFHSTDLRLRLHAATYISSNKLPAWNFEHQHRHWRRRNKAQTCFRH